MTDTRKGFLTPEQEEKVDALVELSGIYEKLDGPAVKLIDNQGLERIKPALVEKFGEEVLQFVYDIVDGLIDAIPTPVKE